MGILKQYDTKIGGGIDSNIIDKIGSAELTTTSKNLSGAVNELNSSIEGAATKQYVDDTVDTEINQVMSASY